NCLDIMAYKQYCSSCLRYVAHFSEAFFLKLDVSDRQHFVNDQDFPLQVSDDIKSETHIHTAGVTLHRGIDEFFNFGEGDDLVEFTVDFHLFHSQEGAVEVNVLPAGQFVVEASAHFQ